MRGVLEKHFVPNLLLHQARIILRRQLALVNHGYSHCALFS